MKKKILFILLMCILVTGCSSSKESVAMKVAKCLEKEDYKCIINNTYNSDKYYMNEDYMKDFIEKNNLSIKDNKVFKIDKNTSNNNTVNIKIDNNKMLELTMIKDKNKWKVNLDNQISYIENTEILIPIDSTLKINDTKISNKDLSKENSKYNKYIIKKSVSIIKIEVEKKGYKTLEETLLLNNYTNNKNITKENGKYIINLSK